MSQKEMHIVLIDDPGPYAPLKEWEPHLRELEHLPTDVIFRDELIEEARRRIEEKMNPALRSPRRSPWPANRGV
jgi:hypothetical protein